MLWEKSFMRHEICLWRVWHVLECWRAIRSWYHHEFCRKCTKTYVRALHEVGKHFSRIMWSSNFCRSTNKKNIHEKKSPHCFNKRKASEFWMLGKEDIHDIRAMKLFWGEEWYVPNLGESGWYTEKNIMRTRLEYRNLRLELGEVFQTRHVAFGWPFEYFGCNNDCIFVLMEIKATALAPGGLNTRKYYESEPSLRGGLRLRTTTLI